MKSELKYDINKPENDNQSLIDNFEYVICSTPRSGSTLLSTGLASTGIAGLPHEYFNVDHMGDYRSRWQFESIEEFIDLLKKHRVSDNGVFAMKIHFDQYQRVFNDVPLSTYFPNLKYIMIKRQDKVLQGISHEIAKQSGQWSSDFRIQHKPKFNYSNIGKNISSIMESERKWEEYFKKNDITPIRVDYEKLAANYDSEIKSVLNALDLNDSVEIPPQQIQKQGNRRNKFWRTRYNLIKLIS